MNEFLFTKNSFKRILSSIFLIIIALISIIYSGNLLITTISVLIFIITCEWINITENISTTFLKITKSLINVIIFLLSLLTIKFSIFFYSLILLVHLVGKNTYKNHILFVLIGPLYICMPFILLYKIRFFNDGLFLLLAFFILVWTTDSFSYFCGKYIGGKKLSKSISPNKTWSGFICGIIAGTLVTLILFEIHNYDFYITLFNYNFYISSSNYDFYISLLFGFTLSLFTQFGDLLESYIKRKHLIKDSGKLIPGHGGFLDRLDGLLVSSVMLYLGCMFYGV